MTLAIEVSGQLEAALQAQAHAQGLTADRWRAAFSLAFSLAF
jgi:hypothetical protein